MALTELYALNSQLCVAPYLCAKADQLYIKPQTSNIKHRRIRFFPSSFISILRLASVSALKFEASYKEEKSKTGQWVAAIIERKIIDLSIETKVAIAVATGLVVLIVGAMAQG